MWTVQPVAWTQQLRDRGGSAVPPPLPAASAPPVPPASWITEEVGDDIAALVEFSDTPINCANLGEENKGLQESQQRRYPAPSGFLKASGTLLDSVQTPWFLCRTIQWSTRAERALTLSTHLFKDFISLFWHSTKPSILHFNRNPPNTSYNLYSRNPPNTLYNLYSSLRN